MFDHVKTPMFKLGDLSFFEDGTYHGPNVIKAHWKYEDDYLHYKHTNMTQFERCVDPRNGDENMNKQFKIKYDEYVAKLLEKEIL
jgi:hypothetical protein